MWPFLDKRGKKGDRGEDLPEPNDGPPDSTRPQGLCPRCGKQSSFESLGHLPLSFETIMRALPGRDMEPTDDPLDRVASLRCRNCRQATAVIEEKWVGEKHHTQSKSGTIWWKGVHWWPLPDARVPAGVPNPIADAFAEAVRALTANCPRAALVMARRTLEAIAVDKGQATGSLADRVRALSATGALHPTLAEWAMEVRLAGNLGAHFDLMSTVSTDDAKAMLAFVRELMRFLYELPTQLARVRTQRQP
ncbi:MAG: DUF4145 domain-containing protein [Deltaproteobacteria bacterium]|nr:DUF4145 domain-containing protein [Deltaproteobacteria bacterium]